MSLQSRIFNKHLDDGEKILAVAHKSVIVLKLKMAKTSFFGFLLPIGLYLLFPKAWTICLIWLLCAFFVAIYHFLDWYFDAWLLTNNGVIDIENSGLLDMTSTRIDYHMIEGISYSIKGLLQTVFNYGDITIDKLGAKTSVVLKDAAKPKKLERMVMKYQEQFVFEQSVRDHQALKTMLSDMIAYHVQHGKIQMPNVDKKKK